MIDPFAQALQAAQKTHNNDGQDNLRNVKALQAAQKTYNGGRDNLLNVNCGWAKAVVIGAPSIVVRTKSVLVGFLAACCSAFTFKRLSRPPLSHYALEQHLLHQTEPDSAIMMHLYLVGAWTLILSRTTITFGNGRAFILNARGYDCTSARYINGCLSDISCIIALRPRRDLWPMTALVFRRRPVTLCGMADLAKEAEDLSEPKLMHK